MILTSGGITAGLVVLAWAVVLALTVQARSELSRAEDACREEELAAQELVVSAMDQVAILSQAPGDRGGVARARERFRGSVEAMDDLVETCLAREPSPVERERLEEIMVQVERVDSMAQALPPAGDAAVLLTTLPPLLEGVSDLGGSVFAFQAARQTRLDRLEARAATRVQLLYVGGALASVLLLAGVLLLIRFLRNRVARPLETVVAAAGRMERGDLAARVGPQKTLELDELAGSFNRMAESLASTQERLEARNREVEDALTRILTAQVELIQAEKLSAMGRIMGGLAHHLNNPLASVLGHTELLDRQLAEAEDPVDPSGLRSSYVAPVLEDARRARSLIQSVLRYSRPSKGGLGPVDLTSALEVALGLRRFAFDNAGLEIEVEEVTPLPVEAEEQRLTEVLLAVLNNALEAMDRGEGGTLRIRARAQGDQVHLEIADEGPGIAEPERIFEPFFTTKPVGEGTGMGLSLVRRYMAEFGGSVEVSNREEGGARVVLRFQAAPEGIVDVGAEDLTTGAGDDAAPGGDTEPGTPEGRADASPPPPEAPPEPAPGPSPDAPEGATHRVLVVEDERSIRSLESRLLARLGVEAVTAANARDARELLGRDDTVDAVISDVKMPGESGIDLYRWIQEERPELAPRVLFVTGDVSDPEVAELAAREPERFLRKPFEMDVYLRRVGELLGSGGAA